MRNRQICVSFFSLLSCGALGQTAYTTFSNGNPSFNSASAYVIGGTTQPAFQFESEASGQVINIQVAVGNALGVGDQTFAVRLYDNKPGMPFNKDTPGAQIGSWSSSTNGISKPKFTNANIESIDIFGGPELVKGDDYWIAVSAVPDLSVAWLEAVKKTPPLLYNNIGKAKKASVYEIPGAFSVNLGITVPGPESFVPFVIGAIGLIRRRSRGNV